MDLAHDAIQAALNQDWSKAVELNEKIVNTDETDIGALLRLAHAYFEKGDSLSSQKIAQKALTIEPENKLAQKCIERCSVGRTTDGTPQVRKTNLKAFLETPGKTRLVHLVNLGQPKTLTSLCSGEPVQLDVNSRHVSVETTDGVHVGRLPDDVAAKIGANKHLRFWAAIKYAGPTEVSIVIHEQ